MLLTHLAALALWQARAPSPVRYEWRAVPVGNSRVEALAVPAKGAELLVAAGGFGAVVLGPNRSEPIPMDRVDGVATGDYQPDIVVAVGHASEGGNLRFSLDGGANWRACPNPPSLEGGSIATSPDGRRWVWSGTGGAQWSDDYGFTWSPCEGLPAGARIVADRTAFRRFYSVANGALWISDDGGRSFEAQEVVLPGTPDQEAALAAVFPTPGRAGDLYLLASGALYRSRPGGPFVRVSGITDPVAFGFGQGVRHAFPGNTAPTLFVAGTYEGRAGLFRSEDGGSRWSPILGAPPVAQIASLTGDLKRQNQIFLVLRDGSLVRGGLGR